MTLTAERLRAVLNYDPETGVFRWIVSRGGQVAGQAAGHKDHDGYIMIRVDRVLHRAHRLAYLYVKGEWPSDEIDHEDCVRSNNRWSNLRPASGSQNMGNAKRRVDNISGVKGVCWYAQTQRWSAQIGVKGRKTHLGYFKNIEDAAAAYAAAAQQYFGEFARCAS